jgi:hypothetical protein
MLKPLFSLRENKGSSTGCGNPIDRIAAACRKSPAKLGFFIFLWYNGSG